MRDVHPWLREWRGVIVQPGDIGLVTEMKDSEVLVLWTVQSNGEPYKPMQACWCDIEIVEVV